METMSQEQRVWQLAIYASHLATGFTLWSRSVKSNTIQKYIRDVAKFIGPHSGVDPRKLDPTDRRVAPPIQAVIDEVARWETVPNRREPLTLEMVATLRQHASTSDPDSLHSACLNWFVCGLHAGFRMSEWGQSTQTDIEHPQCDAKGIPLAFRLQDIELRLVNNRRTTLVNALSLKPHQVERVRLTFTHQKNGELGEVRSFTANPTNPHLCFVRNFLAVIHHFLRIVGWRFDIPISVFRPLTGEPLSVTGHNVAHVMQETAAITYSLDPNIKSHAIELARWTSHSIRVGACVILHSEGFTTIQIQFLLRWRSDAFMEYLRNVQALTTKQTMAIDKMADMPQVL